VLLNREILQQVLQPGDRKDGAACASELQIHAQIYVVGPFEDYREAESSVGSQPRQILRWIGG